MLTTIVLVATLASAPDAAPDAPDPAEIRALARAMWAEMDSDSLLADQRERIVVLSAMLCDARDRKAATEERLAAGPVDKATFKQLTRAAVRASRDIDDAVALLAGTDGDPLPCAQYDVHHLLVCLSSAIEPLYCQREQHVAAQVAAAARLREVRR